MLLSYKIKLSKREIKEKERNHLFRTPKQLRKSTKKKELLKWKFKPWKLHQKKSTLQFNPVLTKIQDQTSEKPLKESLTLVLYIFKKDLGCLILKLKEFSLSCNSLTYLLKEKVPISLEQQEWNLFGIG